MVSYREPAGERPHAVTQIQGGLLGRRRPEEGRRTGAWEPTRQVMHLHSLLARAKHATSADVAHRRYVEVDRRAERLDRMLGEGPRTETNYRATLALRQIWREARVGLGFPS